MRKSLFNRIKAGSKGGKPGQWSARKAQMLAKLGIKESDLGTKKANNVKSPKAIAKDLAHTQAIETLRTNKDVAKCGTMKFVYAIGLKNNKPQELNGEYFVIDNVVNDKGQKGQTGASGTNATQ